MKKIKKNLDRIFKIIENKDVELVAVTKKRSIQEIKQAMNCGVKIIAENRIKEAEKKYNELNRLLKQKKTEFHFIGHVQNNKAKQVIRFADLIHTLDSVKLAKKLNKYASKINKIQRVLIQINIGNEPQKYGIKKQEINQFLNKVSVLGNLKIQGLMCLSPYFQDPEKTRPYFKQMKNFFDKLKKLNIQNTDIRYLSMGTSFSYETAIHEGANLVRVGSKIFDLNEIFN